MVIPARMKHVEIARGSQEGSIFFKKGMEAQSNTN